MFSAPSIAVGRPPVAGGARRHPRRRGRFHAWVVADTSKKDVSPDETTRKDQATTQRQEQRRNNAVAARQGGNVLRRGTRLPDQSPYMQAQATRAGSFAALAVRNFGREFGGLVDTLRTPFVLRDPRGTVKIQRDDDEPPSFRGEMPECFGFTLDNEAILAYDKDHPAPGPAPVPAPVQVLYDVLLFFVDRLYEGRAIERFWFLETVARMPYFAYTTCLHLYETMGWYRAAELRRWGGCRDVPRERLGTTETYVERASSALFPRRSYVERRLRHKKRDCSSARESTPRAAQVHGLSSSGALRGGVERAAPPAHHGVHGWRQALGGSLLGPARRRLLLLGPGAGLLRVPLLELQVQ